MMYEEFWYVLIFHNCPFLSKSLKKKITQFVEDITPRAPKSPNSMSPSDKVKKLLCDFLQRSNQGNKPEKSFFNWGRVRAFHTRFALAHAHALSILHYQMCYIALVFSNLPTSLLNTTIRAAFMPDTTLNFLPIFSSSKCTKTSMFSGFLHSLPWSGLPQRLRYFQA